MTTRSKAAALLAGLTLMACSSSEASDGLGLEPYLCTLDDLGGGFNEQTSGAISLGDIAALSDGGRDEERRLRESGLREGRFIFWKEALPKPPFDPPANVVCEVLAFDSETSATAWVVGLSEAGIADPFAAAGVLWLPGGNREVQEALPDGEARVFHLRASEGDARVGLFARYEARGRLVLAVFAGDRDGLTLRTELDAIAQRQAARLRATGLD